MADRWLDAQGTAHARAQAPPRIISLVPSITELLFALGLGEHVVGRTTFCVHPRAGIDAVPRIGGTKTVNLERARAQAPTHAIVNIDENTRECAKALAEFVPSVVVTHPCTPDDNATLYALLGGIFGQEEAAHRLERDLTEGLAQLRGEASRRRRLRVLYLIWRDPWMTVSTQTYLSRTLAAAGLDTVGGGDGIEGAQRYPSIEPGEVEGELDAVLLSSEPFPFKPSHADEVRDYLHRPDVRVAMIDGEMTSWYGSRAIAGLAYLGDFAAKLQTEIDAT